VADAADLFQKLVAEFGPFTLDPCATPENATARGGEGRRAGRRAGPVRTDTRWWRENVALADVRFLPGRLRFGGAKTPAPFPSAVVVFRPPPETVT
jgi:hypothetical protein